jgi:hypothetical protein
VSVRTPLRTNLGAEEAWALAGCGLEGCTVKTS